MNDPVTTANLNNSQHAPEDGSSLAEWRYTQRGVEQPVKDMVSGMAATFRREKSLPRGR